MKRCEYKYLVYYYWYEDMEHMFEAITDIEEKAKKLVKTVERRMKKQGYTVCDQNSWGDYDIWVGYEKVKVK